MKKGLIKIISKEKAFILLIAFVLFVSTFLLYPNLAFAKILVENTTPEVVIAIAKNEVGYLEKKSNSNLDNKTANSGSANYTKYAALFDKTYTKFYNGKKNGVTGWCDIFVDWCFVTAFGYENGQKLLCQPEKSYGAGPWYSYNYYKNNGQTGKDPKIGAQIFFWNKSHGSTNADHMYHTGLVYNFDSKYVYTIEGNTSNKVAYKKYARNDSSIYGYGYPGYTYTQEDISDRILSFNNISCPTTYKISSSGYVWGSGSGTITAKDGLSSVIFNIYDKDGNCVAHYENNQNVTTLTMQSITSKIKMSALTVEGYATFEIIATDVNGHKLEAANMFTASKSKAMVSGSFSRTYTEPTLVATANHGNSTYSLYQSSYSWNDAALFAMTQAGHLATITSSEENEAVANLLSAYGTNAYIGGYYDDSNFVWSTSESMSYTNWNTNEPNHSGSLEKYMVMYGTRVEGKREIGTWNDTLRNGYSTNAFVVEVSHGETLAEEVIIWLHGESIENDILDLTGYNPKDKGIILTAYAMPEEASGAGIEWTVSDPSILRYDSKEVFWDGSTDGHFTIIGVGETDITATATDGSNASKTIHFGYYISSVDMPASNVKMQIGDTHQMLPTIVPDIAQNTDLIWESSDPSVATVDENGLITAIAAGTATITVVPKKSSAIYYYDAQASCTVSVTDVPYLVFNRIAYPNVYKISSNGYVWGSDDGTITAKDGLASVIFNIYDKNGNRVAHYENNQNVTSLSMQSITSKIKMSALTVEGPATFEIIATDVNGKKLEFSATFTASNTQSTVTWHYTRKYIEPELQNITSYGGHEYYLYKASYAWDDACAFAQSQGGYLAVITSEEENEAIIKKMGTNITRAWIGGYRNTDGGYLWTTGETMDYTNWYQNEPALADSMQNYMVIGNTGVWYDASRANASYNYFFVEVPVYNNYCGDNATWSYNNHVLTISGTGDMYDYESSWETPWSIYFEDIDEVVINNGITSISSNAFNNLINLKGYVTIPSSVSHIGDYAFDGGCGLIIPESIEDIGYRAVNGCYCIVDENNPYYSSIDGTLFNKNKTELISCPKYADTVTIPDTVTRILGWAFANTRLATFSIPDGVTAIGEGTFCECEYTNIVIPNQITVIGNYAFLYCSDLTSITIPRTVQYIGWDAFYGCDNLVITCYSDSAAHQYAVNNNVPFILLDTPFNPDFTMPLGTRIIEEEAFAGIAADSVKLPEGIASIGSRAFADCPNLHSIYIPESCTSIAADVFTPGSDLTIYGQDGSYAEFYAGKHGFDFIAMGN